MVLTLLGPRVEKSCFRCWSVRPESMISSTRMTSRPVMSMSTSLLSFTTPEDLLDMP